MVVETEVDPLEAPVALCFEVMGNNDPIPLLGGVSMYAMVQYVKKALGLGFLNPVGGFDFEFLTSDHSNLEMMTTGQYLAYIKWKCLDALLEAGHADFVDGAEVDSAVAEAWFGMIRYNLELLRGDKFPVVFWIH